MVASVNSTSLRWILLGVVVFAVVAFFVLRWAALRIARRVAESTERRLAQSIQHGTRLVPLPAADAARNARYLAQVERLAWLMDRAVPLPVVGGVGLDALLGLVPGVGDAISFGVSAVIVIRAAQMGVPRELITRLVAIQCTDILFGALPLVGDLFDVVYKADLRSAALIREALEEARVRSLQPPAG